jgi:DNA invertase Pin-like site-specific DNA recombinase
MFQMLGVFAEFERAMIQERVRAGLARARAEGKQLGRPKIAEQAERAVRAVLKKKNRPGLRKIASTLGVGVGTVQRRIFDRRRVDAANVRLPWIGGCPVGRPGRRQLLMPPRSASIERI